MLLNLTDNAPINGMRVTGEGYLVADAFTVRTGIQQYLGSEVGRPDLPVVNVYRPESEVFSKDSLASFSHIPITDDHPAVAVTSMNWRDFAIGETGGEVLRDGERLRVPLIVKDARAVAKIQSGKRELSAGYTCELVFEDGIAPDGTRYQAVQRKIRANHLAVVHRGRAGSEFRIGDAARAPVMIRDNGQEAYERNLRTAHLSDDGQGLRAAVHAEGMLIDSQARQAALYADACARALASRPDEQALADSRRAYNDRISNAYKG